MLKLTQVKLEACANVVHPVPVVRGEGCHVGNHFANRRHGINRFLSNRVRRERDREPHSFHTIVTQEAQPCHWHQVSVENPALKEVVVQDSNYIKSLTSLNDSVSLELYIIGLLPDTVHQELIKVVFQYSSSSS